MYLCLDQFVNNCIIVFFLFMVIMTVCLVLTFCKSVEQKIDQPIIQIKIIQSRFGLNKLYPDYGFNSSNRILYSIRFKHFLNQYFRC